MTTGQGNVGTTLRNAPCANISSMPRGRPRKISGAPAETDRRLLDGVRGLVERNAVLEAENRRLRALLDDISKSLRITAPAVAAVATPAGTAAPRRRGRPRKNPEAPLKVRRKITDPEVLRKRRDALTKARAVRAERIAAARG